MNTKITCLLCSLLIAVTLPGQENQFKSISLVHIDRYIGNMMETNHISGLSATIVRGNETVWQSSYGIADRSANRAVTDETEFLLYSMSKSFIGVALLKILEEKGISPDDPINGYLPFAVNHPRYPNEPIRFRMLMGHVSGIRDNWTEINKVYSRGVDSPITLENFLRDYLTPGGTYYNATSNFGSKPGTGFSYSNIGGALAGLLVERIAGQSFDDYCRQNILIPLGMVQSHYFLRDINLQNLAIPYAYQNGNYQSSAHLMSPLYPAGFLHSSNLDMALWLKFMLGDGSVDGNKIISEEMLELMRTPSYPELEPATGLFMGYDPLYSVWGHTGALSGMKTCYFINREENWGISVLTNGAGDPYPIFYFLMQVAREYEKLSVSHVEIGDPDGDNIPEKGESILMNLEIRNNTQARVEPLFAYLRSNDPGVDITVGRTAVESTTPGGITPTQSPFELVIGPDTDAGSLSLVVDFYQGEVLFGQSSFVLPIGIKETLLVHDEHHPQKSMAKSMTRYQQIFDELGIGYTLYDLSLRGAPKAEMLNQYEAVYWMTGLDNNYQELMTEEELSLISGYLDQGGNLFITGQNINDQIGNTTFFSQYLHSTSVSPNWTGSNQVVGVSSTDLGQGLRFGLSGGDSNNTQYSPGAVNPANGGVSFLTYSQSANSCGVLYSGSYKVVYLSFGLEGISDYAMAKTLVERADQFFSSASGTPAQSIDSGFLFYPNPVDEYLNIHNPFPTDEMITIKLFNQNGRLLGQDQIQWNGSDYQININSLAGGCKLQPGIYGLGVGYGKQWHYQKMVKL